MRKLLLAVLAGLLIGSCGPIEEDVSPISVVEQHSNFEAGDIFIDSQTATLIPTEGFQFDETPGGTVQLLESADNSIVLKTSSTFSVGKYNAFSTNTRLYLTQFSYTVSGNAIVIELESESGAQQIDLTATYPSIALDQYYYAVLYDEVLGVVTAYGELIDD